MPSIYYQSLLDKARKRRETILALYQANGQNITAIAEIMGVSRARIQQILKRAGYTGVRMGKEKKSALETDPCPCPCPEADNAI